MFYSYLWCIYRLEQNCALLCCLHVSLVVSSLPVKSPNNLASLVQPTSTESSTQLFRASVALLTPSSIYHGWGSGCSEESSENRWNPVRDLPGATLLCFTNQAVFGCYCFDYNNTLCNLSQGDDLHSVLSCFQIAIRHTISCLRFVQGCENQRCQRIRKYKNSKLECLLQELTHFHILTLERVTRIYSSLYIFWKCPARNDLKLQLKFIWIYYLSLLFC